MKLFAIISTTNNNLCILKIQIKTKTSEFELLFPELSIDTLLSVLKRINNKPEVSTIYYLDPTLDCGFDYNLHSKRTTIFVNNAYSRVIVKHKKIKKLLRLIYNYKQLQTTIAMLI
jgi:hypothetical protein